MASALTEYETAMRRTVFGPAQAILVGDAMMSPYEIGMPGESLRAPAQHRPSGQCAVLLGQRPVRALAASGGNDEGGDPGHSRSIHSPTDLCIPCKMLHLRKERLQSDMPRVCSGLLGA